MQLFFINQNTNERAVIECDRNDDTVGQIRAKIEKKCGSEVSTIIVSSGGIGMTAWHDAGRLLIDNTNLDEKNFCTLVDEHCGDVLLCSHFFYRTVPVEDKNLDDLPDSVVMSLNIS